MSPRKNELSIQLISMIIPSYRHEKTIVHDVNMLYKTMQKLDVPFEIIVVVDGSPDRTYERAKTIKKKNIRIYGYEVNKGKGYAVKYGVRKAKGDIIGFIDGGMDIDASGISLLLDYLLLHDADIVIGSKLHPDSVVSYPFHRKVMSWGYRSITKLLFNLSVKDTQVGLKLFKKEVAKDVFPRNLVKNFAFDVETLALAHTLGYTKIYEAPIRLDFKSNLSSITSFNFWKISLGMLIETFGIFYRLRIKKSYRK